MATCYRRGSLVTLHTPVSLKVREEKKPVKKLGPAPQPKVNTAWLKITWLVEFRVSGLTVRSLPRLIDCLVSRDGEQAGEQLLHSLLHSPPCIDDIPGVMHTR
jgi:hypothetical protein